MLNRNTFVILMLLHSSFCFSQETGCITETSHGEYQIDTKIDFSRYNGFFIGEAHVDGRQGMKLALLKYLNKEFGITDFFMEFGYSAAFLYNRYIASGDVSLVDMRYNQFYKTDADKLFWKDLYEYNKTLDKKIVIHGMDYENSHFYYTLYLLRPIGKDKPAAIARTLNEIEKKALRKHVFKRPSYNNVRKDVLNHMDEYKEYYGDNFGTVKDIMINPTHVETAVAYAKNSGHHNDLKTIIYRDSTNCKNVLQQLRKNNINKYIVFVGSMHINAARKNSLYNNIRKAEPNSKYVNIILALKNSNKEAEHKKKYRYLIGTDENDKDISYDTNYAILENIYEKHFNRNCKYTLVDVNSIDRKTIGLNLKKYTDYLLMGKYQW